MGRHAPSEPIPRNHQPRIIAPPAPPSLALLIRASVPAVDGTGELFGLSVVTGCSLLPDARNSLAGGAMHNGCGHVLFIDDDMSGFTGEGILGMLATGHDCIGGCAVVRSGAAWMLSNPRPVEGTRGAAYFELTIVEGKMAPEDWWFCQKWRALGGRTYAADAVRLLHHVEQTLGNDEPIYPQRCFGPSPIPEVLQAAAARAAAVGA